MNKLNGFIFFLVVGCINISMFTGCRPENKLASMVYLQNGDSTLAAVVQQAEPVVQAGDRLSIVVSAQDPVSAAPYNLGSVSSSSATGTVNGGYLVENDGTIQLPQFGKWKVAGFTRKRLIDSLTSQLGKYVNDPLVTVQFLNFKVTVLGEVNKPGTVTVPEGKINILEALGMAGDLTSFSRRDNIMVIREKDGKREFGKINLLSKNLFASPYYLLQQNDVIYVELTKDKAGQTDQIFVRNLSIVTSVISLLSTVVILIVNITK